MKDTLSKTGKINDDDDDEGIIDIHIVAYKGNVVINFDRPVSWIAMEPDSAIEFSKQVLLKAVAMKDESTSMIEKALQRSSNYFFTNSEERWEIDKDLGILDWLATSEEAVEFEERWKAKGNKI